MTGAYILTSQPRLPQLAAHPGTLRKIIIFAGADVAHRQFHAVEEYNPPVEGTDNDISLDLNMNADKLF